MIVRVLIMVIAVAGLAAAGRAWELGRAPLPPLLDATAETGAAVAESELRPASVTAEDLAVVRNLVERPPFSASRRPAEATEQAAESPDAPVEAGPQALNARLLGVIRDGSEQLAVVVLDDTGETVIVREGTKVGEWRVEIIQDSQIILRNGDETAEIELFMTE